VGNVTEFASLDAVFHDPDGVGKPVVEPDHRVPLRRGGGVRDPFCAFDRVAQRFLEQDVQIPLEGVDRVLLVVFVRRRDDDGVDGVVQLVVFVVDVNVVPSGKARSSFGGDVHSTGQRDAEFHESLGVVLADVSQPDDTSFDICSVRCHFPVILELPSFVSHQSDTPCGAISNILARRTSVRCQTRHGDQLELGESRLGTESSAEPIVSLPFQLDGNPRAVVRFPVSYGLPSVSSGHPRPAMGWAGTR